jgi:putative DNA primase/helicase
MDGNDTIIQFLQRIVGYSLTGSVNEQALFFFYGTGANGKSTFINAIQDLMGPDYSKMGPKDLLMLHRGESHPTDTATLYGARFVACVEPEAGRGLAESLVKSLTGGDKVSTRRMREDFWDFWPTHKIVLSANHKPKVKGTDHAIWRRIKLIPFNVEIPDDMQDRKLGEKLKEELSGILTWAIEGCLDWQRNGLQEPVDVVAATSEYRREMDRLGEFFDEKVQINPDSVEKAKDIYECYKSFCEENGERTVSQRVLGLMLRERGYEPTKMDKVRSWKGLKLQDSEAPFQ